MSKCIAIRATIAFKEFIWLFQKLCENPLNKDMGIQKNVYPWFSLGIPPKESKFLVARIKMK